eukprot:CAMPEP_0206576764 /NCGR_PEP_ID=MMETSP0325_2-20121206/30934_1 /ASSEMBLY_ACC=CAM_ASM_000347 /TAXON_ID=2866 /ORGANISM="Crypthecodinium cohnii, Strain Seligo" /LENGTH=42 /DNA_ID= /DNA_START= /DNA_END= /DNA_ORIENTATION=
MAQNWKFGIGRRDTNGASWSPVVVKKKKKKKKEGGAKRLARP